MLWIRDVYTGSEFFHPGSRIRSFSIPDLGSPSKNLSIITQKIVSQLSEIWSGLFIPDPDPVILPNADPWVKKAPDPGSTTTGIQSSNSSSLYSFLSQELGANAAGVGAAAQAERQQRHSLHQAGPRVPPLSQGVRPGLSRQIRPVGEHLVTTRMG